MSTDGDDVMTSMSMYFGKAKVGFNKLRGCKKMLSREMRIQIGICRINTKCKLGFVGYEDWWDECKRMAREDAKAQRIQNQDLQD